MRPSPPASWPRALLAVLAAAIIIHVVPACGGGGGQDGGQSATIAFTASASSGDESATPVHVQIALSAPLASDTASVDVAVTGGTATSGADFTLRTTTVTIPAGQTQATVDLDVAQDGFDEPDETVELTLSNPRTAGVAALTLGAARVHTYTINAQSASATPTLSLRAPDLTVPENGGSATVVVELSRAAAGTVTVDYAVSGGTATAGVDYSLGSGTLTFPAGSTTQSFSVPIADDSADEDDETVLITLSNASGAQVGGPATETLTIADDDPAPVIAFSTPTFAANESDGTGTMTVALNAASGRDVTVSYGPGAGSTASGSGVDYSLTGSSLTIPAGQTTATIPITIVDDTLAEGNEVVNVALANPVNATLGNPATAGLTIIDNDGLPLVDFATATSSALENGGPAAITLTLSAASNSTVQVNYAVTGGTATRGTDYTLADGIVTFTPGQTSRTISVGLIGDNIDEDDETVIITLSNPVNALLGARPVHTFTITDDDPSPALAFANSAFNAPEANPTATITVNLTGVTARTVSVNYAATGGTATGNGTDYSLTAGTLTYAPGETSKTVPLTIVNDALNEVNETVVIALSSPVNGVLGPVSSTTCTIQDDDPLPTVAFGAATSSASESVASPAIPVTLSAVSGRTVSVGYAVSAGGTAVGGGTDYTLAAGTLTFPAGTTSLNIPISVVNDTIDEPNETVPITLSGPVGATLGTTTTHTFTINDDDPAPTIQFQAASSSGSESVLAPTITVTLSNASSQNVTVNYAVTGGTATTADYANGSGTITFTPGQTSRTLGFSVVNDNLSEDDETVIFTLSSPTNGTLGTQTTHTYTIQDNDPSPTVQFLTATSSALESVASPPITVTLSAQAGRTVTVTYAVTGGTATGGGVDYTLTTPGTLSFPAGTTSLNLPITVIDDTIKEPGGETITFGLSSPVNATIGTQASHTFTIADND